MNLTSEEHELLKHILLNREAELAKRLYEDTDNTEVRQTLRLVGSIIDKMEYK